MKPRALATIAGGLGLLCAPALAFAQMMPMDRPIDILTGVVATWMPVMAGIAILLFALIKVLGEEAFGTLLLGALAIVFFPVTLIVFAYQLFVSAKEMREQDAKRRELADAEAGTRAAFDDWLTEAVLRAEIAVCVEPSSAEARAELDRLQAAKQANGVRLVELHDRPDTAEVTPGHIEAVKGQWATLQQA
ncbi:hypothetical protein [Burkholderia sp. TSV86]|uniref:hypothetical protein n=1 Tax=Burkholderia sp. TSV86 TaxID=1385594 RepID=UPI00075416C1|nr:hypothetical protein [Burkholderia sp. TSV86]KVE37269.1 hypothetical protein WS68_03375 [Burkholderia sp. TSV86]